MSNSLINEKSPYLLEHAGNPVNWYPWGEAAFEKARSENKPVFLSIGYSTCHWCHVMAAESFEDEGVAAILNEYYVSVKVDREERPDVDSVYIEVCTSLTGSGGWPLTVIMTPEQKPFFAATYIPRESTRSRMGLKDILRVLAEKWEKDPAALIKSGEEITGHVSKEKLWSVSAMDDDFLHAAYEQLSAAYDKEYGGFGTAPKFPAPQNLIFLMRYAALSGEKRARELADGSLKAMYRGGIFDHIGGGFARYSTDREWLAPHFEKTLYDNSLLAYAYTEAYESGRFALYRSVAESTLDYCMRELLSPEGGYCSGQDADSEGVEGAYYLLTQQDVEAALGAKDAKHFCECYDITDEGNFLGKNIPNLIINQRWNLLPEGYDDLREKLRLWRGERMTLRTDNKVLTGWNGLMLMALAKAAAVFKDRRYLSAARELAEFMERELWENGRLRACLCGGTLRFEGKLEDYAFYALGLLELYRADYQPRHILKAAELAEAVALGFADGRGGYYKNSAQDEKLIFRPREIFDGALPSGNSACAVLFDLLWRLCGDYRWRQYRDELLDYICGFSEKYPAGCPFALCAAVSAVYPTRELLCVAPDETVPELLKTITSRYSPELTVLLKSPEREKELSQAAPFTQAAVSRDGNAAFYVCENGACREGLSL